MDYIKLFLPKELKYFELNVLRIAYIKCIKLLNLMRPHIPFMILYSIAIYSIVLIVNSDTKLCYFNNERKLNELENASLRLLEDILSTKAVPKLGKSIFFLETGCKTKTNSEKHFLSRFKLRTWQINFEVVDFTFVQACAVESAALHNPDTDIYILFSAPTYISLKNMPPYVSAALSYTNVQLYNIDLLNFTKSTPTEKWFRKYEIFQSSFPTENLSDFLRFLLLWRWGGTYLDMDVVSLKSLANLSSNFIGAESWYDLNAAVINLAVDGIGHRIANLCLEEFQNNFKRDEWGFNGPLLVTRVLQQLCGVVNAVNMVNKTHCLGMKILPRNAFYPIHHENWEMFFNPVYINASFELMKNSYVAHLWNHKASTIWNGETPSGAFKVIAKNNCPKVYKLFK